MSYLRVLLGCESIGIIILPRVPLLAARERSSVEMLLDASSPSAPGTSQSMNPNTLYFSSLYRKGKTKAACSFPPAGTEYLGSCDSEVMRNDEAWSSARDCTWVAALAAYLALWLAVGNLWQVLAGLDGRAVARRSDARGLFHVFHFHLLMVDPKVRRSQVLLAALPLAGAVTCSFPAHRNAEWDVSAGKAKQN